MSTTYGLAPGAIENNGTQISLDNASAFTDGNGGQPEYFYGTTSNDSFSFGAPQYPDPADSAYVITFGDDGFSQTDEVNDLTLSYSGVTLTQFGAGQLVVDDSLNVLAGTIDLGTSGDIRFTGSQGTFTLDGVLLGSGSVDSGGPAITGTGGKIIAINNGYSLLSIGSAIGPGLSAAVTSGADLEFENAVANGVTITVDANSNGIVGIFDLGDFQGAIAGLTVNPTASNGGAYVDLTNYGSADIVGTSISDNTITITGASGILGTIKLAGDDYTGKYADWTDDGTGHAALYLSDAVCFVSGTRILTPKGAVAVETLTPGDEVMVVSDGKQVARPVKWTGYRRLDLTRQKDPAALAPVRFLRGSLGHNLPERDLLVSPPHCMFIDGKLIPAKLLVNNMTIFRDTDRTSVEYYHIELDRHAIIIAEAVKTESYLDTGNRSFFSNAGLALMLHPEFHVNAGLRCWETDACAPLAVSPAAVYPAWKELADRAVALGYQAPEAATTDEADIHLLADGRRLDPVSVRGRLYTFVVPRATRRTVLASRSVVPSDLVPYLDDPREIGVAVRKISVQNRAERQDFGADHPSLAEGWHAAEYAEGAVWRWTKGHGVLPVDAESGPAIVEIAVAETTKYRIDPPRPDQRIAA